MDLKDVRIDGFRTAVEHWTGSYKVQHLPTGLFVQFECDWRDYSQKRGAALYTLAERVERSWAYASAQ